MSHEADAHGAMHPIFIPLAGGAVSGCVGRLRLAPLLDYAVARTDRAGESTSIKTPTPDSDDFSFSGGDLSGGPAMGRYGIG